MKNGGSFYSYVSHYQRVKILGFLSDGSNCFYLLGSFYGKFSTNSSISPTELVKMEI